MERANGFRPEYLEAAISGEVASVAAAAPSSRNDTLNRAAFNLASLGIAGSDIIGALKPAAEQCGLRKSEIYATINSGMRAGRQQPRPVPVSVAGHVAPAPVRVAPRPVPAVPAISVESVEPEPAAPLPRCDAPDKFASGDLGPPARYGELRRHVYRRSGVPVRVKIKIGERDGGARYQNWYAVAKDNGATGWQAQKPAGYVAAPYVGSGLDPFDPELSRDTLLWPEGEKDCDTLARQGAPAFTFGGTGDGLADEAASFLAGRHVAILSDNDAGGEAHALKKAALAHAAGAASVRVVHFPELPPKGDVTDFLEAGGTIEDLHARIDAAPQWLPPIEAPGRTGRQLIWTCAADIQIEPVRWFWPGVIPAGAQTVIAGMPGVGKSQLTCYLAAVATGGQQLPDNAPALVQGNVIFLSAEDSQKSTIAPRLMAAGADTSKVGFVGGVHKDGARKTFNLAADLDLLEQRIEAIGGAALIVIDPISAYMAKTDARANTEVRATLEPIGELAERLGIAVVSVTHFNKGGTGKAINRVIDSIAFTAAARAAYVVADDPDDETRRLFLNIKSNLAAKPPGRSYRLAQMPVQQNGVEVLASFVDWESGTVEDTADEIMAAIAGAAGDRTAKAEAMEFLAELLAAGPVPQKDVQRQADAAGFSWPTIKRAKRELGVKALREGVEGERGHGRWLWSRPENDGIKGISEALRGSTKRVSPLIEVDPLNDGGAP
jgi:putative DNA primase/helicase